MLLNKKDLQMQAMLQLWRTEKSYIVSGESGVENPNAAILFSLPGKVGRISVRDFVTRLFASARST